MQTRSVCDGRVWGARRYVFVEYGPMELDLNLRVRVHELEQHPAEEGARTSNAYA